jgi:thiamine biosynthesis lipoprotein
VSTVGDTVPLGAEVPRRRYVEQLMGMPVCLALRGRHVDDAAAHGAWAACVAQLRDVDHLFSTYLPDSWVSRLDRGEVSLADCPPVVAEVLAIGERARKESGGVFDVRRPDSRGRVRLDPSGVVKGWAVQRAAVFFGVLDDTDVCLSAGGDLVCRVADSARPAWRIGIEDPADPARVVAVVPVRDGAVATSGRAHRGDHVVDARTGRVPAGIASVTVVAADLTDADVEATTAFALGGTGAGDWLRRRNRTGLVVRQDGSVDVVGPGAGPR